MRFFEVMRNPLTRHGKDQLGGMLGACTEDNGGLYSLEPMNLIAIALLTD
jgi:hypothetical protein